MTPVPIQPTVVAPVAPLPGDELLRERHALPFSQMFAFILRRLAQAVLVMLTVGLIAFSLFRFVGDPVAFMLGQDAIGGVGVSGSNGGGIEIDGSNPFVGVNVTVSRNRAAAVGGAITSRLGWDLAIALLEDTARSFDQERGGDGLRRTLAESLAGGGQGSRDGGRTRGSMRDSRKPRQWVRGWCC